MMNPHTLKRMKTEALLPRLADREAREAWEKKGSPDTATRAKHRVREILSQESAVIFSPEVEANLRAHFADLVPAQLEVPDGL